MAAINVKEMVYPVWVHIAGRWVAGYSGHGTDRAVWVSTFTCVGMVPREHVMERKPL
jgi:hypothetical protein